MARYEHLPIYKSALDLAVHFEKLVAGFPRYHKYTLGTELREASRAVLMQVVRANNAANAVDRRAPAHWERPLPVMPERRLRIGGRRWHAPARLPTNDAGESGPDPR
jgi:hypothetical protein